MEVISRRPGVIGWKFLGAFIAGLALTALVVALIPTSRDHRYSVLTGDAVRLTNVYHRIVADPAPIDVAFIGTSHTMYGVKDGDIQAGLSHLGIDLHVANLGVVWGGRDLEVMLAKLLYQYKAPKILVVEVDQHETPSGHLLVPYVGDIGDMFCCKNYLNYDYPHAVLVYLRSQMKNAVDQLWGVDDAPASAGFDHGWLALDTPWDSLAQAMTVKASNHAGLSARLRDRFFNLVAPYGMDAVKQIVDLARSRGTQVAFVYLPARADLEARPGLANAAFYASLAPMFSPPAELASSDANWGNWSHISPKGADLLVPCLVRDIAELRAAAATSPPEDFACGRPSSGQSLSSRR